MSIAQSPSVADEQSKRSVASHGVVSDLLKASRRREASWEVGAVDWTALSQAGRPARRRERRSCCREPAEERAYVTDQERRRLQGGEVATALELGPVHDVVVTLGQPPDGDILGER